MTECGGIAGMVAVLITDFLFDYLNVAVFHGGMMGMAFATALSYFVGFVVLLTHFTKKDRILRFSSSKLDLKEVKGVLLCSVTSSINLGSMAVRGICFNAFLLAGSGTVAVAAISGANSLFSIVNAVLLGTLTTTSALVSMLFGEEDRNGIVKAARFSNKFVLIFMGGLMAVMFIFAGIFARGFLDPTATEEIAASSVFIRFMAVQNLLQAITFSQCGVYQGTNKNMLSNIITLLREAALPIAICLVLGNIYGLTGFEYGLVISGIFSLLSCFVIPSIVGRKPAIHTEDRILRPGLGSA